MTETLSFSTNAEMENIIFYKKADSWTFIFSNNISVIVDCGFWRVLENGKILRVSLDDGQLFGRQEPVNLVNEIKELLKDRQLIRINVDNNTADLTLIFTNNLKIDVYITSSGYESYSFSINGKNYIDLGSGDIAIF